MMYCRNFCSILLILLLGISLIGCGTDEDAVFEVDSGKALTVGIEKVGIEITESHTVIATYKVVADTAPKTDVLVRVALLEAIWGRRTIPATSDPCGSYGFSDAGDFWVTLPKGKKESETIETEETPVRYNTKTNGYMAAKVIPLPVVDIVGEGEVIDQESLQDNYGGSETVHGQQIPEDFVFPYYEADPKETWFYRPGKAKIINIDPPPDSVIEHPWWNTSIEITFDAPPECPDIQWESFDTSVKGDHNKYSVSLPFTVLGFGHALPITLTLSWGSKEVGTDASATFAYTLFRPH